ncbi:hypothetical protein GPA19_17170 [Azoarcus indigens]|uniref:type II toxin-antitoxin system RelE/ParE family toxin n=1 Tax=Azoarcus indigens TaxID=29545 RepID=UPI0010612469|nr:type II toxin-antitoxin system RelE/ParE family toxin [Azoarcus indigens]NMG66677.1 hypothetical protein [Azoarcus indigens]
MAQLAGIEPAARRKLEYLDAADDSNELRTPPDNRLEALRGKRTGRRSIRINAPCGRSSPATRPDPPPQRSGAPSPASSRFTVFIASRLLRMPAWLSSKP